MRQTKCQKRGYHDWVANINSIVETADEMTITSTCSDCGAVFEATGDWMVEQ